MRGGYRGGGAGKRPEEGRKAPDEGRKRPDLGALAASGCDRERNFHATAPRSLRRTQKALRRPAPALAGLRPPSPACARPRRPAPALAGLRPPSPACARPRRPAPALAGLRPPSPAWRTATRRPGQHSPAWAALAGLGSTRRPGQHSPAWAALAGLGSTSHQASKPSSQIANRMRRARHFRCNSHRAETEHQMFTLPLPPRHFVFNYPAYVPEEWPCKLTAA